MNNLRYRQPYGQKGQAMVFSLLFFAVSIMTLLILYNQGQLVKNRVQLENAADAAVYSQAKLAARNLNFIAYTNRAMVANEVSIGQMVSLLSWAKHYKNVGAFSSFPAYTIPIAPPSPLTLQQLMAPLTAVYTGLGNALVAPLRQVNQVWPTAISYFNGALGIFQKVFALSTLEAEIEMNLNVVKDNEFSADKPEIYTPVVGWYFFVQNTLLTYFGENISPDNIYKNISGKLDSNAQNADAHDMIGDFIGEKAGTLDNMINNNTSGVARKKKHNAGGGQDANMNAGEEDSGDGAVDAYKRFAAIVNNNREAFTRDRHWDIGPPRVTFSFPLNLDIGIVKLKIKLDLGFWMGIKNDGGTAYVSHGSIEEDKDIASLGWSALDVTSFGIQIDIGLFVSFEICLPIIGCNGGTIIDVNFSIPIGLPLAGATHQLVSDKKYAKRVVPEWGYPMMAPDVYGGDINDVLNQGSFDLFHLLALGWGSVAPSLPGGMFGVNPVDVTDSYSGPPSFFSLGDSFQESGVGYEFVIALAKTLDEVETTDKSKPSESGSSPTSLAINTGASVDWDDKNNPVSYTRFDVETHSRVEGTDIAADYQEFIWNDERPMMTISAAETYFANPMQKNKDGSDVAPSLFSPFWDARLKEPSAISMLIATGEVKWSDIFDGLSDNATANDIIDWVLQGIATRVVEVGVDNLADQMDGPGIIVDPMKSGMKNVAGQATDAAIEQLPDFNGLMP